MKEFFKRLCPAFDGRIEIYSVMRSLPDESGLEMI